MKWEGQEKYGDEEGGEGQRRGRVGEVMGEGKGQRGEVGRGGKGKEGKEKAKRTIVPWGGLAG